jgi:hypothetical protein
MELKERFRTLQTALSLPWSEAAVGILTLAQQLLHMELKVKSENTSDSVEFCLGLKLLLRSSLWLSNTFTWNSR